MRSKCPACHEWHRAWYLTCDKCGHNFDCGNQCPYYRKELYSRDDMWNWEGESCGIVNNFEYHWHDTLRTEDKAKHKCDTPDFERDCPLRKHWESWYKNFRKI